MLAWLASALIGGAGALAVFPLSVMAGTSAYWDFPHGVVGGSWADMATSLSGYETFVRQGWTWPLLSVSGLGGAAGTNIIFTDSTPVLALLGRVLFRLTGTFVPLYGPWSGFCVVAMALASTALVRALGARSPMAAAAAAAIGVSMPALLARWGHLSLMAEWLVPLSLAAYVSLHRARRLHAMPTFGIVTGLSALSLLIHPYLFFMTGAVMGTVPLQAVRTGRMRLVTALAVLLAAAASLVVLMASMGHLSGAALEPAGGFGIYSTNLVSAFVPQLSGVLPFGPDFIIGGAWGQYEGFAYLGLGVLVLLWISRLSLLTRATLRAHPFLLAVVLGCTVLAVSNTVYLAQFHLFTVPLPDAVLRLVGIVRSSGRFIWVPVYLGAGLAVAAAARHPRAGIILLAAAALQWADAGPLRAMVRDSVASSAPPALDRSAWASALATVDRVVVDPPWQCIPNRADAAWFYHAAIEVQLMASATGRATNTIYAARVTPDCTVPPLTPGTLVIHLHGPAALVPPADFCQSSPNITACSLSLPADVLRGLTQVDTTLE